MLIIGERINGTRPAIGRAIAERDGGVIRREALLQRRAGADYLDLNAGTGSGREAADLAWLVDTVQAAGCVDLCLDSADPDALAACLPMVRGRVMLNSINGEKEKLARFLPLLKGRSAGVVALAMDDRGMPATTAARLAAARGVVGALADRGVNPADIYLDPLLQPVSVNPENGRLFIEALQAFRAAFPAVRTTCGLSNVSFGLPGRRVLNLAFLVLALGAGLDSAIMDPTEPGIAAAALAAEGLTGRDEFCLAYMTAFRAGRVPAWREERPRA